VDSMLVWEAVDYRKLSVNGVGRSQEHVETREELLSLLSIARLRARIRSKARASCRSPSQLRASSCQGAGTSTHPPAFNSPSAWRCQLSCLKTGGMLSECSCGALGKAVEQHEPVPVTQADSRRPPHRLTASPPAICRIVCFRPTRRGCSHQQSAKTK
jgi:hypothetical protein